MSGQRRSVYGRPVGSAAPRPVRVQRSPGSVRPPVGGGRKPPRRSTDAATRVAVLLMLLVILGVGAAAAFGGWALWRHFSVGYVFSAPPRGAAVSVTVPEGATLRQIADLLEVAEVVPSARAFRNRAEDDGFALRFQPGTYDLYKYDRYGHIVDELVQGSAPPTTKVTLPEGLDARDMAAATAKAVPEFSREEYVDLTLRQPLPYALEGKPDGARLEGMLWPATYEFPPLKTARGLIELQLDQFTEQFARVDLSRAQKKNLTAYDVVIIASMIEREVQVAAERRLVAAVIYNRLRIDMPLQIDATIIYALGRRKQALTLDDLKIDSPYNTYTRQGLPPTPICNPGLASLKAAAAPASVDYLYYVVRNDGSGRHAFSNDYDQFLKDKAEAGL